MAPTSSGLQPFKVIQITDAELTAKIQPIAYGQSQIVDSSHLLVFAAYDEYTKERLDQTFNQQETECNLAPGTLEDYKNTLLSNFSKMDKQQQFEHAARQAYIAFGVGIAAAAEQRVDATPMEGFDASQLDELLGLTERGLKSVTILAIGYRDESNDWLVNMKKVRINPEDFIINYN